MNILFLHGFTGSGANWADFVVHGNLDVLRVLTPDLPGHGANLPADLAAYTMKATAETLMAQIESDETLHLYGYSMGGRLALYLALTYPNRFASLTLESASPGLKTEEERAARRASDEALADRIEQKGIEAFVDEWEKLALWESQARTLIEAQRAALHEQRLRNDPQGLANSLRGMGTGAQPSLWDGLYELRLPMLLITGEYDFKFGAIAHEIQFELLHAERKVIPNAGHAAHLEQPKAVWDVWSQFVGV